MKEMRNRNELVRSKAARSAAKIHAQTLDEWGPGSSFQKAASRVKGKLKAITTDQHFSINFTARTDRDWEVRELKSMLKEGEDAQTQG